MTEVGGSVLMLPLLAGFLLQPRLHARPRWVRIIYYTVLVGMAALSAASLIFGFKIVVPLSHNIGNALNFASSVIVVVLGAWVLLRQAAGQSSAPEASGPQPHGNRA